MPDDCGTVELRSFTFLTACKAHEAYQNKNKERRCRHFESTFPNNDVDFGAQIIPSRLVRPSLPQLLYPVTQLEKAQTKSSGTKTFVILRLTWKWGVDSLDYGSSTSHQMPSPKIELFMRIFFTLQGKRLNYFLLSRRQGIFLTVNLRKRCIYTCFSFPRREIAKISWWHSNSQ